MLRNAFLVLTVLTMSACQSDDGAAPSSPSPPELVRVPYTSHATGGDEREFLVYVPTGYGDTSEPWPVLLFLHGNGERGNGRGDLGHAIIHGPVMEAWKRKRDLPFIMIAPQLPQFEQPLYNPDRTAPDLSRPDGDPAPRTAHGRLASPGFKASTPFAREGSDAYPSGSYEKYGEYPENGLLPQGWDLVADDVMAMVDTVLTRWNGDSRRLYVTGLSYGGFGSFHYAARYPDRWAAVVPVVGSGNPADAQILADAGTPIWMFTGGADLAIKPHWLYTMARALEDAGHPDVRLTVHEDMGHDVWKRVYGGEDIYAWMLAQSN